MPHLTPPRRWQPLTDSQYAALAPHLHAPTRSPAGRPTDTRRHLDALFFTATAACPWHALPAAYGRPDTASRHARRLAASGLFQRLLTALASRHCPPALREIAHDIVAAARRATRLRSVGLHLIALARRLGFLSVLPGPPHWVPDPDLSGTATTLADSLMRRAAAHPEARPDPALFHAARALLRAAGGRARLPRRFHPV
ncbi:transposase [Roseomonas sp. NAR14]|uniref:Transposase n=1 Tax=Roseomonas acroporae TaxID=2937791 RepID=A0A9X1YCU4_9PROT|nr:transposase [Roseomonas acroporae]MCK8786788.1 transposase [Roseomonas acroporae]